jgi:hypothetical protein
MTTELRTISQNGELTLEAYANNLKAKTEMAAILYKSGMLPARYKSPEAVLATVIYGHELDLSPMQALNSIYMVNGNPTVDSHLIKAKVITNGGDIKVIEWTATVCELEMTRPGMTATTFRWTIEDAKQAGVAGKDVWKAYPKQMLYARCVTVLGRNMYADVLKGLKGKEEMEDAVPIDTYEPVAPKKKRAVLPEIKTAEAMAAEVMSPEHAEPEAEISPCFAYDLNKFTTEDDQAKALAWVKKQEGVEPDENRPGVWLSCNRLTRLDSVQTEA